MSLPIPEVDVSQLPPVPSDQILVVDVREDHEWSTGHIDGAVHIPMMTIPSRLDEIPTDRQVLVVCRVGARSAQVTALLASRGWDAVNLVGGMLAWEAAGRPMASDGSAPPSVA